MTARTNDIAYLLLKHLKGQLSAGEHAELQDWRSASPEHAALMDKVSAEGYVPEGLRKLIAAQARTTELLVAQGVPVNVMQAKIDGLKMKPVHQMNFLRRGWFRYAAAVLIIIGLGAYLWIASTNENRQLVENTRPVKGKNDDVLPGRNKAVLTLSDGREIILDSASAVINDGDVSIDNNNGQVTYSKGERVAMNTMTTPKGGQYQLRLADRTKVWLNAASSITYPTAFTGNNRTVSITGEVYFEVVANKEKPFIVNTIKESVTVLGTSFNVNAYPEESGVTTSLAEGSVRVGPAVLLPGQAYRNGKVVATDLKHDLAWKNGSFSFTDASLERVMREISRWYDVEIIYSRGVPDVSLWGSMDRRLMLSEVITFLRGMEVNCRLEGRQLIIDP